MQWLRNDAIKSLKPLFCGSFDQGLIVHYDGYEIGSTFLMIAMARPLARGGYVRQDRAQLDLVCGGVLRRARKPVPTTSHGREDKLISAALRLVKIWFADRRYATLLRARHAATQANNPSTRHSANDLPFARRGGTVAEARTLFTRFAINGGAGHKFTSSSSSAL